MSDGTTLETTATPRAPERAARTRIPLSHHVLGLVARGILGFFRVLPASLAYGIANLAAVPLEWRTRRRDRRVFAEGKGMERNLRIVFRDELTPRRLRNIQRAWARHMTMMVVDFCRMSRITRENYPEYLDLSSLVAHRKLFEGGMFFIASHSGVWEMGIHGSALGGVFFKALARPFGIAPLDDLVMKIRTASGQKVISKWGGLWRLKKAADEGENIGVLADEDVARRPVFTPFLGTLASSNAGIAQLHLATGKPLVVTNCQRVGREKFRYRVWGVVQHEPTGDTEADTLAIMTEVNRLMSRCMLSKPHQWLWGMRRFRTRPEGESPDADGLPPVAPGDRDDIVRAARKLDDLGPRSW